MKEIKDTERMTAKAFFRVMAFFGLATLLIGVLKYDSTWMPVLGGALTALGAGYGWEG